MRSYNFELKLRKLLNCDRNDGGSLLSFGGIANAGILNSDGGFLRGVIAAMAIFYRSASREQCEKN